MPIVSISEAACLVNKSRKMVYKHTNHHCNQEMKKEIIQPILDKAGIKDSNQH